MIKIRTLEATDISALCRLWSDAGLQYRPVGRDSETELTRQMKSNQSGFIGAYEGTRMVGAVLVTDDGRRGWINRIAVHPDFRRKGVALMLIDESERELKRRGLRILAALIEEDNTSSRSLFESVGYTTLPEVLYYSKRESWDV